MENKNNYDVIIIGGGPGGYAAALYCTRAGHKTLLLEEMVPGGQMSITSQVENYPGFDQAIDGFDLALKMQAGAERFGAETQSLRAEAIYPQENPKRVHTSKGDFYCKTMILAMGASPRKLGLPGEEEMTGHGISYCATCDGNLYRGKTVVVAGGGNSAATEALSLSALCEKVYVVHRSETMRAERKSINLLEKTENIEVIHNAAMEELLYTDRMTGVLLRDKITGEKKEIACEGLFVAIGRIPNTKLCTGIVDLDEQGYIIADETTKTNIDGVYAVGDIRTKPLRQIITAAADGAVASVFAEEYMQDL